MNIMIRIKFVVFLIISSAVSQTLIPEKLSTSSSKMSTTTPKSRRIKIIIKTVMHIDDALIKKHSSDHTWVRKSLKRKSKKLIRYVEGWFNDPIFGIDIKFKLLQPRFLAVNPAINRTELHERNDFVKRYCKWQEMIKKANRTNHYSVLLTGFNLVNENDKELENDGRSFFGSMCDRKTSCTVIDINDWIVNLSYVLARSIGHSLGMAPNSMNCGNKGIMNVDFWKRNKAFGNWTECNVWELHNYLNSGRGNCLFKNNKIPNGLKNLKVIKSIQFL